MILGSHGDKRHHRPSLLSPFLPGIFLKQSKSRSVNGVESSHGARRLSILNSEVVMKAIGIQKFGEREVLETLELPVPRPQPGEVLVRIKAAGVNPVDAKIRKGL